MTDLSRFLWSLIDLNGSASRMRGWIVFGLFVATIVLAELLQASGSAWASVGLLAVGLISIVWIVALVQRLHAASRSGYWAGLTGIPFAGLVASIVILCLPPRDVPRRGHPVARRVGAVALVALGLLFLSRAVYWQPYWIPTENMKPTLLVGDFLIATRIKPADLQRGDVVVFRHALTGSDYIKRLVGLPGDKIQMKDGVLHINGVAAAQEAAGVFEEVFEPQGPMRNRPRCENGAVDEGAICKKSRFIETLPEGRKHAILNIDAEGSGDNTDMFTVPEGQYFMMGDNRDNSNDSRYEQSVGGVGFVPEADIQSRARIILFSSAGRWIADVTSWRWHRYLEAVE
ncbi:signal peptidase I [Tabrizicola sp.]|uniref:signal peptidase I n=1 Tax=Tabrizicola sp. TaxID=2005166 RepID=UPI003F2D2B9E